MLIIEQNFIWIFAFFYFSSTCACDPGGSGIQRLPAPFLCYLSACLLEWSAVHVKQSSVYLGQLFPLHLRHHHPLSCLQCFSAEDLRPPVEWSFDETEPGTGRLRPRHAGHLLVHLPGGWHCPVTQGMAGKIKFKLSLISENKKKLFTKLDKTGLCLDGQLEGKVPD